MVLKKAPFISDLKERAFETSALVSEMIGTVDKSELTSRISELSGEDPVVVDGAAYTISARCTTSGEPIQKATRYAYEYFTGLGLNTGFQSWSWPNYVWSGRNVICEIPGATLPEEIILIVAHIDNMPESGRAPGADDNASGAVILLETARLLAARPRRRAIRLIAFGAEEQLSVGSASYVRRHRAEIERDACFMLNFDSCGAALGWYEANGNGPAAMFELMRTAFRQCDREVKVTEDLVPYTDQFPFLVCGVPGLWVSRRCCTAGRFWHHRRDDDLRHLDPAELALQAELAAGVLDNLANTPEMPFDRTLPAAQKADALTMWNDLYGGFTP